MTDTLNALKEAVIVGNAPAARELTEKALAEDISAKQILDEALIPGMTVVGEKFKNNEYYVPEVLIAARAMYAALDILRPILSKSEVEVKGTVVIGTVKGDLHDIGKNLVRMMLEGGGFRVIDLGVDVAPEKFIEAIKDNNAQILAMSALLTTTMPSMKVTIDALKDAGLRDKVKVMVGGAPVTQQWADEIGADGYAPDAASAVDKAKELVGVN